MFFLVGTLQHKNSCEINYITMTRKVFFIRIVYRYKEFLDASNDGVQ